MQEKKILKTWRCARQWFRPTMEEILRLLPERIYLVEKGTENVISNNPATLARFQSSSCREKTDPELITQYETEFFKVDRTLSFPNTQPSLKDGFKVVVVYQDETGNRYFSTNEVTSICNVMME